MAILVMALAMPVAATHTVHAGRLQDAIDAAVDYYPGQTYAYDADLHLHAVYKVNVHYIHFDANGGIVPPETKPVFADDYASLSSNGVYPSLPLEKPTRTGHTFLGWSLSENASSATWRAGDELRGSNAQIMNFYNFANENAEITLYAVWG